MQNEKKSYFTFSLNPPPPPTPVKDRRFDSLIPILALSFLPLYRPPALSRCIYAFISTLACSLMGRYAGLVMGGRTVDLK